MNAQSEVLRLDIAKGLARRDGLFDWAYLQPSTKVAYMAKATIALQTCKEAGLKFVHFPGIIGGRATQYPQIEEIELE